MMVTHDIPEEKSGFSKTFDATILDHLLEGYQIIGYDWRYIYVNDAVVKQAKKSPDELLGKTIMEVYPGIEQTKLFSGLQKCMQDRISVHMENKFSYPNGEKGVFELNVIPVHEGILVLSNDITESKKTEEENATKAKLLDAAISDIRLFDFDGNLLYVNDATTKLTGYAKNELLKMRIYDLNPPEDSTRVRSRLEILSEKGESTYYETLLRKDRSRVIVEVNNRIIESNGKKLVLGVARDITERKKYEERIKTYSEQLEELVQKRTEELLESEKKYSLVVEGASDGVAILQEEKIVFANKKAIDLVGYSSSEIIGWPFLALVSKEYAQLVKERYERRMKGEKLSSIYYLELCSKTGVQVPVEISAAVIKYQGCPADLVLVRDVAERKKSEADHVKMERMMAMGEAATMVGHDLRNPLQAIKSATYVLKQIISKYENDPTTLDSKKAQQMLEAMDTAVTYADKIVLELREYSAERKLRYTKVDINELTNEMLSIVKAPEAVIINTQYEPKLPLINADSTYLKRVVQNITENAFLAMPNGGTLTICSREKDGIIEVTFKDTGIGISEENQKNIFKPFYTTEAKGMGLGLVICKKYIEEHGGTITVESKKNQGSTFTVRLPIFPFSGEVKP